MKAVVGMFDGRAGAEAAATQIRSAGVADEKVRIQDSSTPAETLVEATPKATARRITRDFTLLGALLFGLFGISAAIWNIRVIGATGVTVGLVATAIAVVVVFVLIGLFCGVVIGFIKGAADAEQELQHMRDGLQHGNVLLVVEADKDKAKRVAATIKREQALQVLTSTGLQPMTLTPDVEHSAGVLAAAH